MKLKKVGKIIAIILLVVFILFLGYLTYNYFFGRTEEDKRKIQLVKMTKSFYEDYYYGIVKEEQGSEDNLVVFLSGYADTGLKVSLDSLKTYFDNNGGGMNYTEFADCDENKTVVTIYPKSPYSKKDYMLKIDLSCEKVNK